MLVVQRVLRSKRTNLHEKYDYPKDKQIVTHCATGVRAETAYHKLEEAGYDVSFLNADVEIAKDGSFKLTPKY